MNNKPEISIVICSYNRSKLLLDTLHSLVKDGTTPSTYEIIIVDNNSSDNTEAAVKDFITQQSKYTLRYVKETQQGLSYARNRGIQESQAPLVCFVDDDVIVCDNFIQKWIHFFETHPEAVGGGGKIHVQFDSPRPKWMPELLLPLFGKHNHGNEIIKYTRGRFPSGGNMTYKKYIFEKSGVFNTDLGRKGSELNGGEEKDLFFRVAQQNNNIFYIPETYLWHRVGAQRLTKDYVKGQSLGGGKSIAIMLHNQSLTKKFSKWFSELFKFLVSIALFIGYFFMVRISKGVMIIKFRLWVWKGYRDHTRKLNS